MYISMFELSLYAHAIFLFMVLSSSLFCSFFFLLFTRSPYEKKLFTAWRGCVFEKFIERTKPVFMLMPVPVEQ